MLPLFDDMLDDPHHKPIPKCRRQEYRHLNDSERLGQGVQVEQICRLQRSRNDQGNGRGEVCQHKHHEWLAAQRGIAEGLDVFNEAH